MLQNGVESDFEHDERGCWCQTGLLRLFPKVPTFWHFPRRGVRLQGLQRADPVRENASGSAAVVWREMPGCHGSDGDHGEATGSLITTGLQPGCVGCNLGMHFIMHWLGVPKKVNKFTYTYKSSLRQLLPCLSHKGSRLVNR